MTKPSLNSLTYSWIVAKFHKLHTIDLLQQMKKVVAFEFAHFPWSFFAWGSFLSLFWPFYSFYPLIFLLGYTLFTFFKFFDFFGFQEYGTPLLKKEGLNIFHSSIKTIMKNDTYWYRSLTLAPLGDGFSLWKVKNSRSVASKCLQTKPCNLLLLVALLYIW